MLLDLVFVGGIVIALAGVLQTTVRRQRRDASPLSLLREGMTGFQGSDAEAFRAEFRRSGVVLPEHRTPVGFP
jgi:hypothetical protein